MHKLLSKQNILIAVCTAVNIPGTATAAVCGSAVQELNCNPSTLSSESWLPQVKNLLETVLPGASIAEMKSGQLQIQLNSLAYLLTPVQVTQADANTPAGISLTNSGLLNLTTKELQTITFAAGVQNSEVLSQFLSNANLAITQTDVTTGTLQVNRGKEGTYFVLRPDFSSEPANLSNTPGFYLMPYPSRKIANINAAYLIFKDSNGQLRQQVLPPMPADWQSLSQALAQLGFKAVSLQYDGIINATADNGKTYHALMDYAVIPGLSVASQVKFEASPNDANQDGVPNLTVVYPNGDRQDLILLPEETAVFTLRSAGDVAQADTFLAAHDQPVTLEVDFDDDHYSGSDITLANFTAGDKLRFNTADGIVKPCVDGQHSATANQYMSNLHTAQFQRSDRIIHAGSKAEITLVSSELNLQKAELHSNSLHIHLSGGIKNNNLQFEFF